jgi:hypothetical protein
MLKRVNSMKVIINKWLENESSKFHAMKLTKVEWEHVNMIMNILRSFQKVTEHLSISSQIIIHKAWIVYNDMHEHLESHMKRLAARSRAVWTNSLQLTIASAQVKLKKHYEVTAENAELYFNLDICLNSRDKLDYYKIIVLFLSIADYVAEMFYYWLCRWLCCWGVLLLIMSLIMSLVISLIMSLRCSIADYVADYVAEMFYRWLCRWLCR